MKNAIVVKKTAVSDVVTRPVQPMEVNTDANAYSKIGWTIILVGVFGFLLWASFAPLDRGVPMSGNVVVASNRKVIQHQTGGTVDEILVKDGDIVKAGQVLIKMNNITAKSAAEVLHVQLYAAQATEARLAAERDNAGSIAFPKELLAEKSDARIADTMSLQQQLFTSRQTALHSELSAFDENITGLKLQLKGLQESMINKKEQQKILKEQLEGLRELSKDGYIARNRLLDQERTYAQLNGSVSEDIGNMGRVTQQISEITLRKIQRQQEYQKEVRTQLSEVKKETEALQNRQAALNFDLNNVLVKAPVDGTVVGLSVFTKGAVVQGGFKLMELVPNDDKLIVEASLPVHLIDKVHTGLKTDLIFSAFNTNTTPHIPGVVTQVSADRTVDERTGQGFYKVKVEVAPEGMKKIAHLSIKPGMPVELFVKTGERTMMNYLLKPIIDRANTALSED